MTTKTVYVAFDGKQFNTENECREYEKRGMIPKGVTVFDADFKRTVDPYKAIFIVVDHELKEDENALFLNWINSASATDEPEDDFFETGVHAWDYYRESYIHFPYEKFDIFRKLFNLGEKIIRDC